MGKNRLAIYFFYDQDGIVDEYVFYFLKGLRKISSEIVVVFNGRVRHEYRKRLEGAVDHVIGRENVGYDSWAYKETLEYVGWNRLREFDELVMANFTMFGPIYPFEDMFESMDSSEADFWGIQRSYEKPNMKYIQGKSTVHGYMPEFPLSNFWVIRENLLHSYEFKAYWDTLHEITDYAEACIYHEPVFSKRMTDFGFRMDTYVSCREAGYCNNPTIDNIYSQVIEEKIPIIRRRAFFNPIEPLFDEGFCDPLRRTLEYIEENHLYDTALMYDNLLRTSDLYEFHHRLNHNYMLGDTPIRTRYEKVAIGVCVEDEADFLKLRARLPEELFYRCHVYAFSNESFLCEEEMVTCIFENCNREGLLDRAWRYFEKTDYKYVCLIYNLAEFFEESAVRKIASQHQISNMLGTEDIVNGIFNLFEKSKRVGLIMATELYHGKFFAEMGKKWGKELQAVKDFLAKSQVKVQINETKPYIGPKGSVFWYRNHIFNLVELGREETIEEATLEKSIVYLMKDKGYYPVCVFDRKSAECEINMLHMYIETLNTEVMRRFGNPVHFRKLLKMISTLGVDQNKTNDTIPRIITDVSAPVTEKAIDQQEYLETVKTSLLLKKVVKRILPTCFWNYMRRKRFERSTKRYLKTKESAK